MRRSNGIRIALTRVDDVPLTLPTDRERRRLRYTRGAMWLLAVPPLVLIATFFIW